MRTLPLAYTILFVSLATTSCDRRTDAENQPTPQPAPAANDAGTQANGNETDTAPPTADDSLALGLLGAVNEHEIAAAKQAMEKKVSAPVLHFAEMMDKQHSENQAKTKSLGTLASTPEIQALVDKGKSELEELGRKSGDEYENAYAEAMVKGHTEALSLIDTRLIALASSETVKKHMTETRDHVAMHLEAAKRLQAK